MAVVTTERIYQMIPAVNAGSMSDLVSQFAELFAGRTDAYGTDAGGCERVGGAARFPWLEHLEGIDPIGVYPLVQQFIPDLHEGEPWQWCVKWGCIDLDVRTDKKPSGDYLTEEACHTAAVNLQRVLSKLSIVSCIERTKSCGRHIWVFTETWCTAKTMRNALLVASTIAGTSTREINPKQTELAEGQVGSYVRLPLPGALKNPGMFDQRQAILDVGHVIPLAAMSLQRFVERAYASRTPVSVLEDVASLYKEPEKNHFLFSTAIGGKPMERRLNNLGWHLYTKPVDQITDRSHDIEAFVRAARDSGLNPSETLQLASNLADRTGKFEGRSDRERQLKVIVERAYQG